MSAITCVSLEKIMDVVIKSAKDLYNDIYKQISDDISERFIVHCYAIFFQKNATGKLSNLNDLTCDVEYNRMTTNDQTILKQRVKESGAIGRATVDLVYHHRATQDMNLLCMEVKKSFGKEIRKDIASLTKYVDPTYVRNKAIPLYQYGVLMVIKKKGPSFVFFDKDHKDGLSRQYNYTGNDLVPI